MSDLFAAYAVTFGWALVGSLSMAVGLALTLKVFSLLTPKIDEWEALREGSLPVALVMAAVVLATGIVIAQAIRP